MQSFSTSLCVPLPSWLLHENTPWLCIPTDLPWCAEASGLSRTNFWDGDLTWRNTKNGKGKGWLTSVSSSIQRNRRNITRGWSGQQNFQLLLSQRCDLPLWSDQVVLRSPTYWLTLHGAHYRTAEHSAMQQPRCFNASVLGEGANCFSSNVLIHSQDQNISKCHGWTHNQARNYYYISKAVLVWWANLPFGSFQSEFLLCGCAWQTAMVIINLLNTKPEYFK